ncbi:hypothetical protein Acr_18g0010650 [Actinidia rufa]|uniref:Uncharacterized protein n=1 Tax=Actinidia rufa TaxID=165716 RepID=A0A7J0G7W4_9ERIC|nr:hypothetical protein Acr_18g0010650 [Actinidia rufa]
MHWPSLRSLAEEAPGVIATSPSPTPFHLPQKTLPKAQFSSHRDREGAWLQRLPSDRRSGTGRYCDRCIRTAGVIATSPQPPSISLKKPLPHRCIPSHTERDRRGVAAAIAVRSSQWHWPSLQKKPPASLPPHPAQTRSISLKKTLPQSLYSFSHKERERRGVVASIAVRSSQWHWPSLQKKPLASLSPHPAQIPFHLPQKKPYPKRSIPSHRERERERERERGLGCIDRRPIVARALAVVAIVAKEAAGTAVAVITVQLSQ